MKFYTHVYYTGSSILLREICNSKTNKSRINFNPSLYLISSKESKYKTVDGRYADELTFNNIHEINEFKKTYENVDNFEIHGDIDPKYQFISAEFGTECEYDFNDIGIMYIDMETTCDNGFPSIENPNEKIIAITASYKGKKYVYCLGDFERDDHNIIINEYHDEQQLLRDFILFVQEKQPEIITGWNVRFFDIPYLINRCKKILDEKEVKNLSPWGIIKESIVTVKGGYDKRVFELVGISILDYFELYKTFTYVNQETYKLDHIAYVELGERKLSYNEYDNMADFYRNNFQKFIEYNIKDVELVERLEEKLKLIELAVALAYSAGVNYNDVFSQVRTWDVIIYNYLKRNGIIIPPKKENIKDEQYAGAYVKEPLVGMHNWVVSYDVNSLYPSLIIHFNISPETLLSKNFKGKININDIITKNKASDTFKYFDIAKQLNASMTANGTMYSNEKRGFLPNLMDKMYGERKIYKDKMIEAKKKLEAINLELNKRDLKA